MKRIFNLYGCDVYLDTSDDARAELAIKWLARLEKRARELDEIEARKQLDDLKQGYLRPQG